MTVGARQSDNLVLRFGAFEADLHTSELRKNGRLVSIPPQPFRVLAMLANRSGNLVTREEIQGELWGGDTFVDFEQGLNFCIKRIRAALGDDADRPRYIETLPRRGYRFVAPVEKIALASLAEKEVETLTRPSGVAGSNDGLNVLTDAIASSSGASAASPVLQPDPQPVEFQAVSTPAVARSALPFWRRRTAWLVLAGFVILAVALVLIEQSRSWHWSRTLTEKDTIVLADFANNTTDPVFGDALKAGLAADLSQSTFLNILSDDIISRQLRYMGRANATLSPEVAREVCQRAGSQAMLVGSISSIGSHYAITLKAVGCKDGDVLDVEQAEADRRENVLSRLHQLARSLRNRLGESLASVEKYDAPLEQATTSSLEALQAYSLAEKTLRSQGESATAIRQFNRALELDPNFAVAMLDLGIVYCNLNEKELCSEYVSKAYKLRDRVTERERFSVDSSYYTNVTGELEKSAQALEDWKQSYPRDLAPYINLAEIEWDLGRVDMALTNDLEGFTLKKDSLLVYRHLSSDYMTLNHLDDAKAILDQARARKLDAPLVENFYQLAFLKNDAKEMERCVNAARGSADESTVLSSAADTEAFYGHLERARELSRQAIASAVAAGDKEAAADWEVTAALREAEFGNRADAIRQATQALALDSTRDVQIAGAMAFARAGDARRAQTIADDLQRRFPSDTLLFNYWLPSIHAAIALAQGKPADAVDFLQVSAAYELGGDVLPFSQGESMYPAYLRGQAYFELKRFDEAAPEFRRILNHRGLVWNFPLGALSEIELARCYALGNDSAKARETYQRFFTARHDADANIPVFVQAKKEYSALPL